MVLVAVVTFSSSVWAVETLIGGCGLDMFPYYEWSKLVMIVNRVCTKMFMLLEQCHYVTVCIVFQNCPETDHPRYLYLTYKVSNIKGPNVFKG